MTVIGSIFSSVHASSIRPISSGILLVLTLGALAQVDSTAPLRPRHLQSGLPLADTTHFISVEHRTQVSSSTVHARMMYDYLFAASFSTKSKDRFKAREGMRSLLVGLQDLVVRYHPGQESGWEEWELSYGQRVYGSMGRDLSQALLFGNADFEGQRIASANNAVASFQQLDLRYRNAVEWERWRLHYGLGVATVFNYSAFEAEGMELYTHTDGQYLDIVLDQARWRDGGAGPGAGLVGDLTLAYRIDPDRIAWVGVNDLSALWIRVREWERDSTFRFEGVLLDGEDLISGDPEAKADSLWNAETRTTNRTVSIRLPSTLRAGYTQQLTAHHALGLEGQIVGALQYGWMARLVHEYGARNWALRSDLGYGSYGGVLWAEQLEWLHGPWRASAGIFGVNTLIAPTYSSNLGWSLAFSRAL